MTVWGGLYEHTLEGTRHMWTKSFSTENQAHIA